jgi:Uncharacterized conserved protein
MLPTDRINGRSNNTSPTVLRINHRKRDGSVQKIYQFWQVEMKKAKSCDRTFLISVRPRWASTFFLSHNPKSIELRKGSFGASLQPGDNLVIYSTLPQGKVIGTVKVVKREPLIIDRLWEQSQQGKLTYVTQSEFDAYYSNTICGVGIWVSEPRQWKHPLGLFELREILGKRWQPPQQMQRLTHEQMSAIGIAHQHKRALLCHR